MTTRSVTPDTAMQISAVFACTRLLAETIAGLPLKFFERKAGGVLVPVEFHDLQNLMTTKPNRYQTYTEFMETLVYQLALHGNSYHRVDRNVKDQVISLMPYMTPQVRTILGEDGNITHEYYSGRNLGVYAEESMWHNKQFGNGVIGISTLEYARNCIGIAISCDERVSKMANNGFKPSGILMIDKKLNKEQRKTIRENYSDLVEGGEDSLRILEAGMTFTQTTMDPKDVQLLESRQFQTEDIARFFNVPSILINDTKATTGWGSGIEQLIIGFYKLGLSPYINRLQSSITTRLLPIAERKKIIPKYDLESLLSGDEKTRFETYKTAIQGGIKTPNECRNREGLEDKPGGDSLYVQQQMIPLEKSGTQFKNGGNKNEQKKSANTESGQL